MHRKDPGEEDQGLKEGKEHELNPLLEPKELAVVEEVLQREPGEIQLELDGIQPLQKLLPRLEEGLEQIAARKETQFHALVVKAVPVALAKQLLAGN